MIQLCTDHSLNNDACGEVWAEAGLLETDGNKILSLNLSWKVAHVSSFASIHVYQLYLKKM
jgi:hypothetical protein